MKRTIKFLMPVLGLFAMTIPAMVNAKSVNAETLPDNVEVVKAPDIPELNSLKAHSLVTPTDNYYNTQKDYSMRNLGDIEGVWDHYQGENRYIAVIDNGFNPYDNEYFVGNDFSTCRISEYSASFVYNQSTNYVTITKGTDSGHTRTSKDDDAWDFLLPEHEEDGTFTSNRKHGTHVASTIGAGMNNSGVVGVAPKAKMILIKVANYAFWECGYAMKYLYELSANSGVTIDAVNMSFGSNDSTWNNSGKDYMFQYYLGLLHNLGTVMIAAAGNDNTSTNSYPACNNYVVGIGALNKNSNTEKASFSNFNKETATASGNHNVDLAAPGYVYVSSMNGTYTSVSQTYTSTQGTSFASPIVAAAVGLYKQYNPSATATQVENALYNACVDIGDSGWDATFGYGRLDVSLLVPTSAYVSGVELDQDSITGYHNYGTKTFQLTATVTPLSATNKNVSWSSSDTGVATVSSTGLVTLVGAGNATITVTTNDGGFTDTCAVTCNTYIPLTGVELLDTNNSSFGTLTVGGHMQLHAVFTPSNATCKDIDYDSDDKSIATVSSSGYITAVAPGTTSIFCYAGNELEIGEYTLTVNAVSRTLQSISIGTAPTKTTYNVGETFSLEGAVINATFNTSPTVVDVTSLCTFTPSGELKSSDTSVTISYTYSGVTKTVSQPITVISTTSPSEYTLLSNGAELHAGDNVLFVGVNGTKTYAMSKTQNTNNRSQVEVSVNSTTPKTITTVPSTACEFVVGKSGDYFTFFDASNNGYIYAASSSGNQLKTQSTLDDNGKWTVGISSNNATVTAQGTNSRNILRYNTSGLFACYSSGQQPVQIYHKQAASTVAVTGVTLNKDSLTLTEGEDAALTATVLPSDATNKNITWSSTDTNIATIDNGAVHAVAPGSTTIKVTTSDGGFVASCNVTVNALPALTSISIDTNPTKLTYNRGETFDPIGAVVTAHFEGGATETITDDVTWTPSGSLETTDTLATASYTYRGVTKTASVAITVNEAVVLSSIEITTNPTKLTYNVGETFSSAGAIVTAHMSNGTTKTVTATWTPAGALKTTDIEAVASYTEGGITKTASVAITVNAVQTSGVEIDFKEIPGFSDWSSSYTQRTVDYDDVTVIFTSANKNSNPITNMPVTKGGDVTVVAKNDITFSSAYFLCKQWNTKAQTITLKYSTDGTTFISTGITSTNFEIESNSLPEGTVAVRISFSSNSNQVGIEGVTLGFNSSSEPSALEKAVAWAQTFNATFTCDATGSTAPSASTWNTLKEAYSDLDSTVKEYFENADYSLGADGLTVTALNGTDIDIAKAVAKYDYVCNKYNSATYNTFINRTPKVFSNFVKPFVLENTLIVEVILLGTSLSFIGLVIFKRKKESN